ncbi:MAG: hypothetical protein WBA45_03610 [Microthrixaceae bacterium]
MAAGSPAGSKDETDLHWKVERLTGSAQELHDAEPDFSGRLVRVNEVVSPSLVLGSTQSPELIDPSRARSAGVEVAKRRSGGGVVSMRPNAQCWVDVFIPSDDPLWVDDVTHSSLWIGRCWTRVAAAYGWSDTTVHTGGISDADLSKLVCFAALGPGEVSQGSTKLVGISQRRTRQGAKFQCIVYLHWDPTMILDLVDLGSAAAEVERRLTHNVAALRLLPAESLEIRVDDGWSMVECLLSHLP